MHIVGNVISKAKKGKKKKREKKRKQIYRETPASDERRNSSVTVTVLVSRIICDWLVALAASQSAAGVDAETNTSLEAVLLSLGSFLPEILRKGIVFAFEEVVLDL